MDRLEVTMGMTAQEKTQGTEAPTPGVATAQPREPDPEEKGAAAVEAFARDHEGLTEENERDALDYLFSPKPPRLYGVKVDYDTEAGIRPLTFVIAGMDGRKIDAIEQRNVSEATGKLDAITAECELVAEAAAFVTDASERRVRLDSDEFLTIRRPDPDRPGEFKAQRLASPALALEGRFRTQLGLVAGVARQIRAISGYDPQRVGSAQRRLADAVGNS